MSPYELEDLPDTLKRMRTRSIFVIRFEVLPLQVIGRRPGLFVASGHHGRGVLRQAPFREGAWRGERVISMKVAQQGRALREYGGEL